MMETVVFDAGEAVVAQVRRGSTGQGRGGSVSLLVAEVDGLPNICGSETVVESAVNRRRRGPVAQAQGDPFDGIGSAFTVALHMHQPLIPAGGTEPRTAGLISNLQHMLENQGVGDNHNAPIFLWCYQRIGEIIPRLVGEGLQPRVMLEYSGTLLHGLRLMGASEVLDALRRVTCDPRYVRAVEWLGCPWGHAVAPSTPVHDYRLHVRAWQHHFAALFGLDALSRVRGFSPAEMSLPNHPDVAYAFVRTLLDCGYDWLLVQEHTVEKLDGGAVDHPHVPHRLVCTSSTGETASIVAVVKTQGSDTKLVGQMQPYSEAQGLPRQHLGTRSIPQLVTQIADGENGGVMMNEFPPKYEQVVRECSGTGTPMMNVSEYLELIFAAGIDAEELPPIQPLLQHRIWQRMSPGDGPDRLAAVTSDLASEADSFHMDGGSWTNDRSWVRGYDDVLIPMDRASALFHERVLLAGIDTNDPRYRNALFHLLTAQTSCYRYWGGGVWTDYGAETARRTSDAVEQQF
jgi:hypothetical protein